jgi:hypothetical protein
LDVDARVRERAEQKVKDRAEEVKREREKAERRVSTAASASAEADFISKSSQSEDEVVFASDTVPTVAQGVSGTFHASASDRTHSSSSTTQPRIQTYWEAPKVELTFSSPPQQQSLHHLYQHRW